ncbi:DMT family transporter [Arthrobacter sp. zg-Y40]|uniref:DMT family transporter n=1 Tax=unclassified Arthrobacter TaxID=235627 RepID=UPI001D133AD8|nr:MULTISPECIES: DMT family transporter [unclassified Arthrobacter]MCC3275627.1 DMT family transporter [Arthrobacter sp. zg-Y20]MCC3278701.1 DMT family transporter [Arthrobacter sp. zg-Y40]MDK1315784.1 DMT family transporter [Arthrobacter sp. zg.Y20]WIB06188.1 DMT family transporter [Arthrobacter sp. zg-Y20]
MNIFLAAVGVLGVSASGPIMAATAAPALAIAFWRNALGAVLMGGPAALGRRREFARLGAREYRWTAVAAVALAFHFACFITSLQLTSVAAATALVCLQAGWIALFNVLRGIRVAPVVLAGLAAAFAGVVVISGFDLGLSREALIGDVLAVAGGALAGVYTIAGGKARESMSTGTYTTLCYGACAVLLLALCAVFRQPLVGFPPAAWLGILGVTVVAQILGHSVFNHLLAVISPLVVSMIILLEIPGAAILAAVFLHEQLPAGTYAGLGLILAGLTVVVAGQGRARRRPGTEPIPPAPPALGGDVQP